MSYDRLDYTEVEPIAEGMHFLREPLNCEELGVTVVEVSEGWTGKPHDHAESGEEEVYVLLEGEVTMEVDDEELSLSAGDTVRVDPDATRQLHVESDSQLVVAGAP